MIWNGYGSVYTVLREGSVTVGAAKTTAGSEKLDGTGTPKNASCVYRGKGNREVGTEPIFIRYVPEEDRNRLRPFQERIGYEWNG